MRSFKTRIGVPYAFAILLGAVGCSLQRPLLQPGATPDEVAAKLGPPDEVFFLDGGDEVIWVWRPFFGGTRLVRFHKERAQMYSPAVLIADPSAEISIGSPRSSP